MSYEKQTWETGDIVTSAKLNHMEDGIAEAGEVSGKCTPRYLEGSISGLEESPNDIDNMRASGVIPFFEVLDNVNYYIYYLIACTPSDYIYTFARVDPENVMVESTVFIAVDADSPLHV